MSSLNLDEITVDTSDANETEMEETTTSSRNNNTNTARAGVNGEGRSTTQEEVFVEVEMPPINLIIPMPVPVAGAFPLPHRLIHNLPIISVTEEIATSKRCIVCLTDFILGKEVAILPCDHVFHHRCIKKWLLRSGSCPSCREWVNREYNIEHGHRIRKQARLTAIQRYLSQVNPDEPGTAASTVVDLIDPLSTPIDVNENNENPPNDNDLNNVSEGTSSGSVSSTPTRGRVAGLISNFLRTDPEWGEGRVMDYVIPLTHDDMFSLDLVDVSAEVHSVFAGMDREQILAQIVENSANEPNNVSDEGLNDLINDNRNNPPVIQNSVLYIDLTTQEEETNDTEPAGPSQQDTNAVVSNNDEITEIEGEDVDLTPYLFPDLDDYDEDEDNQGLELNTPTENDENPTGPIGYLSAGFEMIRNLFTNIGNRLNGHN